METLQEPLIVFLLLSSEKFLFGETKFFIGKFLIYGFTVILIVGCSLRRP